MNQTSMLRHSLKAGLTVIDVKFKIRLSQKVWDPLKKNYQEHYILVKDISQEQAQAILHHFRLPDIIPEISQSSLSSGVPKTKEVKGEL